MISEASVSEKKAELDDLRLRIGAEALSGLEHSQRIDITYTSNALEGNTLSAGETALVLEKGLTISGKPLKDHLEAIDHALALQWVLDIAMQSSGPITESDIRSLHQLVVAKSIPEIAGRYADRGRFVNTDAGIFEFPSPTEIPSLMHAFSQWLGQASQAPQTAFDAHRRLVSIHPFNDGNGRTARLLMNLVLARVGYPPIAIRPEDRPAYIAALQEAEDRGAAGSFNQLMFVRLNATLDMYLAAARQAPPIAQGRA